MSDSAARQLQEKSRPVAAPAAQGAKVLFLITTTDFGGTESILLELTRRMKGRGLDLSVCTMCPPGRIGKEIEADGTDIFSLDLSPDGSMFEIVRAGMRLARMLDERGIDLVQSYLYRANVLGVVATKLARRKPILIQGQRSLRAPGKNRKAQVVEKTRRFASHVVAVSDAVRTEMVEQESLPADKVSVIRNGVDTDIFSPRDSTMVRRELGFLDDAFVVGTAARLAPVKGVEYLIRGAAIAAEEGNGCELMLVGDGPLRAELEALASELGIAESTHFLGMRRDLPDLYNAMDTFALPSVQEGSPNALMEAMACGLPCMAAPVGGVVEIVDHDVSGHLVESGNPRAWADAIARFGSDPALRERLATAARTRALEACDIELTADDHIKLFSDFICARKA